MFKPFLTYNTSIFDNVYIHALFHKQYIIFLYITPSVS